MLTRISVRISVKMGRIPNYIFLDQRPGMEHVSHLQNAHLKEDLLVEIVQQGIIITSLKAIDQIN